MNFFIKKIFALFTQNETGNSLNIEDIGSGEELMETLSFLQNKGLIKVTETEIHSRLAKHHKVGLLKGNAKGFGFLSTFSKEKDFYVYPKNLKGAIDGDIVLGEIIRVGGESRKSEVKILDIISAGSEKYLGTFHSNGENGYVILNNKNISDYIYISKKKVNGAEDETKVFVSIDMRATNGKRPSGTIIDVLGKEGDVGLEILTLIRERNIDVDFSDETMHEVENIPDEVLKSELNGREDFRKDMIFTIDGDDTKDFDDAVSLKVLSNGNFELGVHIADVAHYVKEGTALDEDALSRATSVYLVDRVIPMLPTKLSNGICSLNPNVDRLTLSCVMELNTAGKVIKQRVVNGIINSKLRLTYNEVDAVLTGDEEMIAKYIHIHETLLQMEKLAKILMKKRNDRGSIDFDFPESKVILDETNKPIDIIKRERNIATRLIEEFMIVTNETVAEYFTSLDIPFVYRVHEKPDPARISSFIEFVQLFGFSMDTEGFSPKVFQQLLLDTAESPAAYSIRHYMLRSLKKASYSPESKGHFGLASEYYSHFTSPIRRYPDLQIHRIIKEQLVGRIDKKRSNELAIIVKESSDQSSNKEIHAQMAERDSVQLKKAEYMADKIGEVYEGIISGMSDYGLYVSLENTVEGLVHVNKMPDDFYVFNEDTYSFQGERTGVRYQLGDLVTVELIHVNVIRKQIDFKVVVPEEETLEAEGTEEATV